MSFIWGFNWVRKFFLTGFVCSYLWLVLFNISELIAKPIYQKQINKGNQEIELELDAYYTSFDYYLSLTKTPIPYLSETNELNIYKKLFATPKLCFLVFELSTYPMPCAGVFIKKQFLDFYEKMTLTKSINIIKSVTAGFEEPYAVSVFLGNVVSFKPASAKNTDGKGYVGALVSGGNYHIKDNELITDNWLETELKVKGERITPGKKMDWSFRIGTKLHNNSYIKDVLYFSVRRSRTDRGTTKQSVFTNSNFEYIFDADVKNGGIIRHYFLVGKKYPLKKPKIVVCLNAGFLWEGTEKYIGPLKRTSDTENFQILFRPNIEF
ncbi:MAG: hypothetical protein AB1349_02750 [Elusimicrobiota bacterium]